MPSVWCGLYHTCQLSEIPISEIRDMRECPIQPQFLAHSLLGENLIWISRVRLCVRLMFNMPSFCCKHMGEFGTNHLCEQRRFRRACASAQSRQNLRCSLIQAVSHEESSDRKPDPWSLWMAGHAQLKFFVMTECSKTQIRLTRLTF